MSSILDHVEQAVPRATVYGAMKGSPVFIGKYYREINPASNATTYDYASGNRRINIIVASPDKTIFNDMRSASLRFDVAVSAENNGGTAIVAASQLPTISEPASNVIERIVIKMNGTVVEDISNFDRLTSAFKRSLLSREQKNARKSEGYSYIAKNPAAALALPGHQLWIGVNGTNLGAPVGDIAAGTAAWLVDAAGSTGSRQRVKLDLSGIFNCQQLLSGYYSPLEIDLYLTDPNRALQNTAEGFANIDGPYQAVNYALSNVRLNLDQVVMSPEYVSAFEAALLANSSAQGIQIPFTTYYTYQQNVSATAEAKPTFWIRKPVRYLKGVYFTAYPSTLTGTVNTDDYRPCRQYPLPTRVADANARSRIRGYTVSVGTKNYRKIDDTDDAANVSDANEMFQKAVGHFNDYSTGSDEFTAHQKVLNNFVNGIDLEFSPDNDVLASETTLNSNDVRIELDIDFHTAPAGGSQYNTLVMLQYQASIALFPGNETRLLVT